MPAFVAAQERSLFRRKSLMPCIRS
jgi:hypothetical protein